LEEIFADVYGCLVAWPAIALSFQDLQLQETPAAFITSDHEHPVPVLRPGIYTKVLGAQKDFAPWAERLDVRWQKEVRQYGAADEFKLANGHRRPIAGAISPGAGLDVQKPVDRVIKEILDFLNQSDLCSAMQRIGMWRNYAAAAATKRVEQLYPAFTRSIKKWRFSVDALPPELLDDFDPFVLPSIQFLEGADEVTPEDRLSDIFDLIPWGAKGPHGRDHT
jgi:hypothetical protein